MLVAKRNLPAVAFWLYNCTLPVSVCSSSCTSFCSLRLNGGFKIDSSSRWVTSVEAATWPVKWRSGREGGRGCTQGPTRRKNSYIWASVSIFSQHPSHLAVHEDRGNPSLKSIPTYVVAVMASEGFQSGLNNTGTDADNTNTVVRSLHSQHTGKGLILMIHE